MNNVAAALALALASAGCGAFSAPEECKITTPQAEVTCELEVNGRYACKCDDGEAGSFVSDDFCTLDPGGQDFEAEESCDAVEAGPGVGG